jgi:hypothetical protein
LRTEWGGNVGGGGGAGAVTHGEMRYEKRNLVRGVTAG